MKEPGDSKDGRKKFALLIKALRDKTVDNGCTEDEAIAAAKKAAELMDKYDMSLDEVEMRRSEFTKQEHPASDDVGQRLWRVAQAIAELTGTRSWSDKNDFTKTKVFFFGRDTDVEIAGYVLSIVERAIRTSLVTYDRDVVAFFRVERRRPKRLAFIDGMVASLAAKVRDIAWVRTRDTQTGTGLVVVKENMVAEAMERHGISLVTAKAARQRFMDRSFDHGKAAADKVRLDAGLGTSGAPAGSIGHRK